MDLRAVYLKQLEIHGSSQGNRGDFDRLSSYVEGGKLKALVGGVYKLSDLHRTQEDFKRKIDIGKLVIVLDRHWSKLGE